MSTTNPFIQRVYSALLATPVLGPGEMPTSRHFLNSVCGQEMMCFANSLADGLQVDPLEVYTIVMNSIVAGMASRLPEEAAAYLRQTADLIDAVRQDRAVGELQEQRRASMEKIHVAANLDVFYGAELDRSKMS